jgi:ABC-type multidrug transport system ATPase subunit
MAPPELAVPLAQNRDDPEGGGTPGAKDFRMLRQTSLGLAEAEGASSNSHGDHSMQWEDLTFSIGSKKILKSLTGHIEPGRLTAVLGPSGSGKSTLMNVLAGRQSTNTNGASLQGKVLVSGHEIKPVDFRSNVAYVMQDDTLLPTETPRECLDFSAYLRLAKSVTADERKEFVDRLLDTLHLTKCADTMVGSALVKGISGGERKRTSVGVELITNPSLLFLDEPLSGLDSYAAFTLTQALKDLASSGVPVLCTVHQPSSEIFDMFDDIIILHDGDLAYQGPANKLASHFDALGFPCPKNFNPADHVMFLLQKEPAEKIREIKQAWMRSELMQEVKVRINSSVNRSNGHSNATQASFTGEGRVGCFQQLAVLTVREARGTFRARGPLIARYGMAMFLAGLYGWLFAGSAATGDKPGGPCKSGSFDPEACRGAFLSHFNTIVSLSIAAMMGAAQPILLLFPNERPVFLREYAANQYGVVSYFVSKTIIEMPVVLGTQVMTFLVAYWLMGLHGDFAMLVILAWLLGITSASIALIVGCAVASPQKAIQLAPLALLPQMLFSGLFLPVDKIPVSLRWVKTLCPLKYAINLLGMEEFRYAHNRVQECIKVYGADRCDFKTAATNKDLLVLSEYGGDLERMALLKEQSIDYDDYAFDLAMMIGLFVGFRILSTILLWRKGKYVY